MMSDVRNVSDSDAWALLALREASVGKQTTENMNVWASGDSCRGKKPLEGTPLAVLEGHDFEYAIRKSRVTVGRSSNKNDVDVKIGHSTFVSRVHLEICADNPDISDGPPKFFIRCHGKNGIFVDGAFRRKGDEAMQLQHMYDI